MDQTLQRERMQSKDPMNTTSRSCGCGQEVGSYVAAYFLGVDYGSYVAASFFPLYYSVIIYCEGSPLGCYLTKVRADLPPRQSGT